MGTIGAAVTGAVGMTAEETGRTGVTATTGTS